MIGSFKITIIQITLSFLIWGLDVYFKNGFLTFFLYIPLFYVSYVQLKQDRLEIKTVVHFETVEINEIRNLIARILLLLLFAWMLFLDEYFRFLFTNNLMQLMIFFVFLDAIGTSELRVIRSFRSFENGIKLPGRSRNIILWNQIANLEIHEKHVFFQDINGNKKNFQIKNSKGETMNKIIEQFIESKGKKEV